MDDWIKALFVILVAIGGKHDLTTIRASIDRQAGKPSIVWLDQQIDARASAFTATISTNFDKLRLRRHATRDIIVVKIAKLPYFISEINQSTILLKGPRRQSELRFSVFETTWDGRALIISDAPIVSDSDLGRISIASLLLIVALSMVSLVSLYLIYNRFRINKV